MVMFQREVIKTLFVWDSDIPNLFVCMYILMISQSSKGSKKSELSSVKWNRRRQKELRIFGLK